MSGLALIMKGQGFRVQGSDIANNKNIERLKKGKIKIYLGHSKKNLKNATITVISSAIKKSNPARRKSFRARHRCATAKDVFSARYWSCQKW